MFWAILDLKFPTSLGESACCKFNYLPEFTESEEDDESSEVCSSAEFESAAASSRLASIEALISSALDFREILGRASTGSSKVSSTRAGTISSSLSCSFWYLNGLCYRLLSLSKLVFASSSLSLTSVFSVLLTLL